jgi:NAD(P)H dehydrogenase (quinone)
LLSSAGRWKKTFGKNKNMRYAIVFNHPYPGSFCNAILETVQKALVKTGHHTDILHLDNDAFNPVMTAADLEGFVKGAPVDPQVIEYRSILERADHLILIFPIWWELMPAMTKGFIDKVIYPGVAYDCDKSGRYPRMVKRWHSLQSITLITTMNTPGFLYRLVFGNAIKKAVFTGTFWKMGYRNRKWINFSKVKFVTEEKRKSWLMQLDKRFSADTRCSATGQPLKTAHV